MKKSKFIAVAFVFFAFVTSSLLQAQPRQERRSPMQPDSTQIVKMVDELAKAVSLSEKQKEEVLKLHFEHFNDAKGMEKKGQQNNEDRRKAHDEIREKIENKIKALLDNTQKEKFEEYLKKQNNRNRPPRQGRNR